MIRIRRNPLPSPKKIMKRGLYEIMWGAPQRDYGKYVGLDNKKKKEKKVKKEARKARSMSP